MDTDEILKGLTAEQRKQLHEKLEVIAAKATPDFNKDPGKFARVTETIDLRDKVSLHVTISLHPGDKGIVHPVIEEITQ